LAAAVERGATALTVHLAEGGRLDHQLANLAVVSSRRWRGVALQAWVGVDRVWAVWDRVELPLVVGRGVAIQAMGGLAQVTTTGLKYPLDQEFLDPGQARGIANVVVSAPASVRVDEGVVLVISPQT
jgi:thiamine pyrophosphokinase